MSSPARWWMSMRRSPCSCRKATRPPGRPHGPFPHPLAIRDTWGRSLDRGELRLLGRHRGLARRLQRQQAICSGDDHADEQHWRRAAFDGLRAGEPGEHAKLTEAVMTLALVVNGFPYAADGVAVRWLAAGTTADIR